MRIVTTTLLAGGLMIAGVGCNGGYDPSAHAAREKIESAWVGKVKPEYQEVTGKDGKLYVVGTKAAADKVQAGAKLNPSRTAFGYGPDRQTVVFEENKDGIMADYLLAEYDSRHGKSKS